MRVFILFRYKPTGWLGVPEGQPRRAVVRCATHSHADSRRSCRPRLRQGGWVPSMKARCESRS